MGSPSMERTKGKDRGKDRRGNKRGGETWLREPRWNLLRGMEGKEREIEEEEGKPRETNDNPGYLKEIPHYGYTHSIG